MAGITRGGCGSDKSPPSHPEVCGDTQNFCVSPPQCGLGMVPLSRMRAHAMSALKEVGDAN